MLSLKELCDVLVMWELTGDHRNNPQITVKF